MATSTTTTTATLGMRLDQMIDKAQNLSPTELYGLIVAATVALCFVLLGTGNTSSDYHYLEWKSKNAIMSTTSNTVPHKQQLSNNGGRQPRWHIFKWFNWVVLVGFALSVVQFGLNASHYIESKNLLSKFLIGWSVFLCYFFGFFGVSLVHEDALASSPNNNNNNHSNDNTSSNNAPTSTTASSKVNKVIHQAAASTPPLCSDATTATSTTTAPSCGATNKSDPTNFTKAPKQYSNIKELDDAEIARLVLTSAIKDHELEKRLDPVRAVTVRRLAADQKLESLGHHGAISQLPNIPNVLDYNKVHGANCEIVIGYVPLPVGLVGPLTLNDESFYIPMATTEGCLVASTNRGAKAITMGGGARACIVRDGITRAPCVRMASAMEAAELKLWCEVPENFLKLKQAFESTTSFGKLKSCNPTIAGKNVYLRLVCFSGDAMGMNMVSKGSLAVMDLLQKEFPSLQLVALSGNMCTDKKAAATNWLEGRGKSVVVEAIIPQNVVRTTLKTTVDALIHTNLHKNLIGSAMAGALGGFNAHASNIVTAIFLATGQDPAQNVESSNCITLMEATPQGDLWISCTMPSIEVGTVGGGTSLQAQAACLKMLGCQGGSELNPGDNAKKLATVVAAATMAGELSLLSALAANTLVQAHMTHNRKPQPTTTKSN